MLTSQKLASSILTVRFGPSADLLGFFGAFGFAPMTFWMPSVIWLVVMKPKKTSLDFWANVLNIIVFVTIMFLAAIGSIYSIVQSASSYHFYT